MSTPISRAEWEAEARSLLAPEMFLRDVLELFDNGWAVPIRESNGIVGVQFTEKGRNRLKQPRLSIVRGAA